MDRRKIIGQLQKSKPLLERYINECQDSSLQPCIDVDKLQRLKKNLKFIANDERLHLSSLDQLWAKYWTILSDLGYPNLSAIEPPTSQLNTITETRCHRQPCTKANENNSKNLGKPIEFIVLDSDSSDSKDSCGADQVKWNLPFANLSIKELEMKKKIIENEIKIVSAADEINCDADANTTNITSISQPVIDLAPKLKASKVQNGVSQNKFSKIELIADSPQSPTESPKSPQSPTESPQSPDLYLIEPETNITAAVQTTLVKKPIFVSYFAVPETNLSLPVDAFQSERSLTQKPSICQPKPVSKNNEIIPTNILRLVAAALNAKKNEHSATPAVNVLKVDTPVSIITTRTSTTVETTNMLMPSRLNQPRLFRTNLANSNNPILDVMQNDLKFVHGHAKNNIQRACSTFTTATVTSGAKTTTTTDSRNPEDTAATSTVTSSYALPTANFSSNTNLKKKISNLFYNAASTIGSSAFNSIPYMATENKHLPNSDAHRTPNNPAKYVENEADQINSKNSKESTPNSQVIASKLQVPYTPSLCTKIANSDNESISTLSYTPTPVSSSRLMSTTDAVTNSNENAYVNSAEYNPIMCNGNYGAGNVELSLEKLFSSTMQTAALKPNFHPIASSMTSSSSPCARPILNTNISNSQNGSGNSFNQLPTITASRLNTNPSIDALKKPHASSNESKTTQNSVKTLHGCAKNPVDTIRSNDKNQVVTKNSTKPKNDGNTPIVSSTKTHLKCTTNVANLEKGSMKELNNSNRYLASKLMPISQIKSFDGAHQIPDNMRISKATSTQTKSHSHHNKITNNKTSSNAHRNTEKASIPIKMPTFSSNQRNTNTLSHMKKHAGRSEEDKTNVDRTKKQLHVNSNKNQATPNKSISYGHDTTKHRKIISNKLKISTATIQAKPDSEPIASTSKSFSKKSSDSIPTASIKPTVLKNGSEAAPLSRWTGSTTSTQSSNDGNAKQSLSTASSSGATKNRENSRGSSFLSQYLHFANENLATVSSNSHRKTHTSSENKNKKSAGDLNEFKLGDLKKALVPILRRFHLDASKSELSAVSEKIANLVQQSSAKSSSKKSDAKAETKKTTKDKDAQVASRCKSKSHAINKSTLQRAHNGKANPKNSLVFDNIHKKQNEKSGKQPIKQPKPSNKNKISKELLSLLSSDGFCTSAPKSLKRKRRRVHRFDSQLFDSLNTRKRRKSICEPSIVHRKIPRVTINMLHTKDNSNEDYEVEMEESEVIPMLQFHQTDGYSNEESSTTKQCTDTETEGHAESEAQSSATAAAAVKLNFLHPSGVRVYHEPMFTMDPVKSEPIDVTSNDEE